MTDLLLKHDSPGWITQKFPPRRAWLFRNSQVAPV